MREMKDSGIEWIGKIPQEWNIARLCDIKAEKKYAIVDGPFGSAISTNDYKESGIPLIRITNLISSNKPNSSTIKIRYNKCWKRHTSCRIIWTVRTRLTQHIRGR